jgi:integrative and conjugative element protein (TIGR02256 family)
MMSSFAQFGETYPDSDPSRLTSEGAKRTFAILPNKNYEFVELGRYESPTEGSCDVLVVECINEEVPSKNTSGINIRERLALVFPHNEGNTPQARALRVTFPIVPHLNHVQQGEPVSLCLYFEPWSVVRRTWTPQKYLRRVLWWLSETAKGTLHREDQPLEQIYFNSPYELVLAPDFREKIKRPDLKLTLQALPREDGQTIRTVFASEKKKGGHFVPILITLDPVMHGRVERYPDNLGELHDQLVSHGSSLIAWLPRAIDDQVDEGGVEWVKEQACLLILCLPVKRTVDSDPEKFEVRGFIIEANLATLGNAVGTLHSPSGERGRYFRAALLGQPETTEWRDIKIKPLDVKYALTKEFARRASGIDDETADRSRVLAGLGALGSRLADIWSREAWGEWTYIDADHVQPHNIARHDAKDVHVGNYKADLVQALTQFNYQGDYYSSAAIHKDVLEDDPEIKQALEKAVLFIDATTTLEVPRELSERTGMCRSVSVFLTPSGYSSVLLFEDDKRELRLNALEAQYYRAILNHPWGETHLAGNSSHLGVGAGCRSVSLVMSNELVQLHSAILARQIRLLSTQPEARIRLWNLNGTTGSVEVFDVPVYPLRVMNLGKWKVVSDMGIESKLARYRHAHAPEETGGVILGYVDHVASAIFVIDVLPAPPDSVGERTGFIRGTEMLEQQLGVVRERTARIVDYIGEWHSHPPFCSATPSGDDRLLMNYLAENLSRDGEPVLMIIAGSGGEINYLVHEEETSRNSVG